MKITRILLAVIALIMAAVSVAVLTSVTQVTTMDVNGYAVSGSATVKQSLVKGEDKVQSMEKVESGDIIYASALGYYVGTNRISIDRDFPIYINDGDTLKFLDNENWLVTDSLEILETYNGLYLNGGYTYNEGMEQADSQEFILLALNNGLHINVQEAVLTNAGEKYKIPVNSVIRFAEDSLRWYYFHEGHLVYDEAPVGSLIDVELTVGDSTWYYLDFLKALELVKEKIKNPDTPVQEPETSAEAPVEETSSATEEPAEPGSGETKTEEAFGAQLPDGETPEEESVFYLGEPEDSGQRGIYAEAASRTDGSADIPDGSRSAENRESADIADTDRTVSDGEDDIPDTDRTGTSRRSGSSGGSSGKNRPYEKPVISLTDYDPWVYAFAAKLNVRDNTVALSGPVNISVYQNLVLDEGVSVTDVEIKKDSQGNSVYPRSTGFNGYQAGTMLKRQSFYSGQCFALSSFRPGSKIYVQYSYSYYTDNTHTATAVYQSDFTEIQMQPLTAEAVAAVKAGWTVPTSTKDIYARKLTMKDIRLENTTDYKEPETFDFEEYKKNTLPYLNKIVVTLEKTGAEPVTVRLSDTALFTAKTAKADFLSASVLEPNSDYTYTVYALDEFGNRFPLLISDGEGKTPVSYTAFEGHAYTRRTAPAVILKTKEIGQNYFNSELTVTDEEDVIVSAKLQLLDKNGEPVVLSGTIGGNPIEPGTTEFDLPVSSTEAVTRTDLSLNGLESYTDYYVRVTATYDPRNDYYGGAVYLVTEEVLKHRITTARESGEYTPASVTLGDILFKGGSEVSGTVYITDRKNVIETAVSVTAYDAVGKREVKLADSGKGSAAIALGTETFDWRDWCGSHQLARTAVYKPDSGDTARMKLSGLVPGSEVYLQVSYNCRYLDGGKEKTVTVYSDLVKFVTPSSAYQMDTVLASWEPVFAADAQGISITGIQLKAAGDPGATVDSLARVLDRIQLTLTPLNGSGSTVTIDMDASVISEARKAAARGAGADFTKRSVIGMESDTVYSYSIRGYRYNGMEIPMKLTTGEQTVASGETAGNFYTRKQEPQVRQHVSNNANGSVTLTLTSYDPDNAVLQDVSKEQKLIFSLKDSHGNSVMLSGKLDDVPFTGLEAIDLVSTDLHVLELTGLAVGESYTSSVIGGYDQQPTAKSTEPSELIKLNQELLDENTRTFKTERGKNPVVSVEVTGVWAYAANAKVSVSDPSQVISKNGVTIRVTDTKGKLLLTKKSNGSQQMALYPLEPGTRVLLQYSYDYTDAYDGVTVKHVDSEVISIDLPTIAEAGLPAIYAEWEEVFAYADTRAAFNEFYLRNSTDYDAEDTGYSFENFKKDPLKFLNDITVEFTPVGGGSGKSFTITADIIAMAKKDKTGWTERLVVTAKDSLLSNTKYTYTVEAHDRYGNVIPFMLSNDGGSYIDQSEFTGTVFTRKWIGDTLNENSEAGKDTAGTGASTVMKMVDVREAANEIGDMELKITVNDRDKALVKGSALKLCVTDKDGRIRMHGDQLNQLDDGTCESLDSFWQTEISLVGGKTLTDGSVEYLVRLDNLELGTLYTAEVYADVDLQPDAQIRETGRELEIQYDVRVGRLQFESRGSELLKPGGSSGGGGDPGTVPGGLYVAYWPPEMKLSDFRDWAYAIGVYADIDDPTSTISGSVSLTVWDEITGNEEYTVVDGRRVYKYYDEDGLVVNKGKKTLLRKSVYESADVAISPLQPDNTVFVQYSYTFTKVVTTIYTDPETRKKTVVSDTSQTENVISDLTEVTLGALDSYDVDSITGSWTEEYAAYTDTFCFSSLSFGNAADYDPQAEYSWDNFRKNTVQYLNNMEVTVREEGKPYSTAVRVLLGASAVSRAVSLKDGIDYVASLGSTPLKPDTVYEYTVKAYDRYNNAMPMEIGLDRSTERTSSTVFKGKIYTRKEKPSVEIEQLSNESDGKVSFKITVQNPRQSLASEGLKLKISDALTRTNYAVLDYSLKVGETGTENYYSGKESVELPFDSAAAEEVYYLTVESLDFDAGYCAEVYGTYLPQPSAEIPAGKKELEPEENTELTEFNFSTSPLTAGKITFSMSVTESELTSESAVFSLSMRKESTAGIVSILNQIRITVSGPEGTVADVLLEKSDLEQITLHPGMAISEELTDISEDCRVLIRANSVREGDTNLWQAIMGRTEGDIYQNPASIYVYLPKDTALRKLSSKTKYTVTVSAMISRPNGTAYPKTELTNNKTFTTKKTMPTFLSDDPFIAGNVLSVLNTRVLDSDGAISAEKVSVILTDNTLDGATVYSDFLPVTADGTDTEGRNLLFSGLVTGHKYLLTVEAGVNTSAATGREVNTILYSKQFTVEENLTGSLNLESISSRDGLGQKQSQWISYTANTTDDEGNVVYGTLHERYEAGHALPASATGYWANVYTTELFELKDERNVLDPGTGEPTGETETHYPKAITIDMPMPSVSGAYLYIYYYNSAKSNIGYSQYTYKGGTTFVVPTSGNPKYFRLVLRSSASFEETGLNIGYYEETQQILASSSVLEDYKTKQNGWKLDASTAQPVQASGWSMAYMVPAVPGDTYVLRDSYDSSGTGGRQANIYYYKEEQKTTGKGIRTVYTLVGSRALTSMANYLITVPEGATHLAYDIAVSSLTQANCLYKVADGSGASGDRYSAAFTITVNDRNGYLKGINETIRKIMDAPTAKLRLWKSDSTRQTDWKQDTEHYPDKTITLQKDSTEKGWYYSALDEDFLDSLEPDKAWKLSVIVDRYAGRDKNNDPVFEELVLGEITFQTDGAYELIHNRQEMRKILRNPYGNFLVVNDFVNDESIYIPNLYGTLDFQGHVVTYSASYSLLYSTGQSGKLMNLVYDIPANPEGDTTLRDFRPIVSYNYGTMDNVILRTLGDVYKMPNHWDYEFLVYYNYGTVSNFVFELGGDLHLARNKNVTEDYASCLMYINYGVFENWCMYGLNGARLVAGNLEDGDNYGYIKTRLIRWQRGIVRNFYVAVETDISYPTQTGSVEFYLFQNDGYSDSVSNGYVSGDFWNWTREDDGGVITRTVPESDHIFSSDTVGSVSNLWHITSKKYSKLSSRLNYASSELLGSVEWQQGILGERFSTDAMSLGYYPQLKMNDCMLPYRRYLTLPGQTIADAPELVSTDKYEDEYHVTTDSSGYIQLLFNNTWKHKITALDIDGLTVDRIEDGQERLSSGLWQVIAKVHVDEEANDEYLSAYTINSFEYSAGTLPVQVGRKTTGVEFWKSITDQAEWSNIPLHMNWNYRIGTDLTFEGYSMEEVQICKSNAKEKAFTGKIDGAGHTISNITIGNVENGEGTANWPCVIWQLGKGGEIRDLVVDNLQITAKQYPDIYPYSSETSYYNSSYFTGYAAGFVGYVNGGKLDGLHVQNSRITSTGNVGALAGFLYNYSTVYNCSSVNNEINDGFTEYNTIGQIVKEAHLVTDTESYYGGIFGGSYSSVCMSCFTRDLEMEISSGTNAAGAGGLGGRVQGSTVADGYATGSIKGTVNNVGGAIGNFRSANFCHYESIWTNVTLDVTGDFVGGFAGRSTGTGKGILTVGNVYCNVGSHVHRAVGQTQYSQIKKALTAYAGQNVTGYTATQTDDCRYLLSALDLEEWSVWADKVLLDENWDVITDKPSDITYFPKVYKTPAEYDADGKRILVDRQEDIYLPGKGGEQSLEVESAEYLAIENTYLIEFKLTVPGLRGENFKAQWEDPETGKTRVLNIDGLNMTSAEYTKYYWDCETTEEEGGTYYGTVNCRIEIGGDTGWTEAFSKALDCYRMTISYHDDSNRPYTLMADLSFDEIDGYTNKGKKINYWDISSVTEWYSMMKAHGKNNENFRLTKMLDFGNSYRCGDEDEDAEFYRNLRINRLTGAEADISGEDACGIRRLVYTTNTEGDPWITSIEKVAENLVFEDITGEMIHMTGGTVDIERTNPRTGVIFSVRDLANCRFDGIRADFCQKTSNNSAFIMIGYGDITDVTIKNLVYDTTGFDDKFNYGSAFMCHIQGNVTGLNASQIYVNSPNGSYIGGVFSTINSSVQGSQSPLTEITVTGNNFWGGLVSVDTDDDGIMELVESSVRGFDYVGFVASLAYTNLTYNTVGKESTEEENNRWNVESGYRAGGFVYYHYPYLYETTSGPGSKGNKVTNGIVKTLGPGGYAGGMYGMAGYAHSNNYEDTADHMTVLGNGYVGALYGDVYYCQLFKPTVVNCTVGSISSDGDSLGITYGYGGIAGLADTYTHIYGASVRNTTVSGPRNVGGVAGRVTVYNNYTIQNCYVAEDVRVSATSTEDSNAGGIVGYGSVVKMYYCACGASVNASGNNAGGLVGQLKQSYDSAPVFKSCYFVGNVTGKDYVGGIIGLNQNEVAYPVYESGKLVTRYAAAGFRYDGTQNNAANNKDRETAVKDYLKRGIMNGVTVAGSFNTLVTEGAHISAWYNNYIDPTQIRMEGDDPEWLSADDPRLLIWNQCILNGVPVNTSGTVSEHSRWLSSEMFRRKETWTSATLANLGTTYFDYDFRDESEEETQVLKVYMPYVKYRYDSTQNYEILKYSNYKSYQTVGETAVGVERAGIRLPDYGTNPDAIRIYASDVDKVNIEVTKTSVVTDDWADYTQVEYLQCSGTQWIDTGYTPKSEYVKYEFRWEEVTELEKGTSIFGAYQGGVRTGIAYHSAAGRIYSSTGTSGGLATVQGLQADTVYDGTIATGKNGTKNQVTVTVKKTDDTVVGTNSGNYSGTIQNGKNIALFGDLVNGSISELSGHIRLYSWKMYEDTNADGTFEESELVCNMVPCYRTEDNITGMYDLKRGSFHTNRGTSADDFIRGAVVSAGSPNAVTPGTPGADQQLYVKMGSTEIASDELVTDANGILTLSYGFNCDISVSADRENWMTVTADELRRAVAVTKEADPADHDYWYYIGTDAEEKRIVCYGTRTDGTEKAYTLPAGYQKVKYIEGKGDAHGLTDIYGDVRVEYTIVSTDTSGSRRLTGYNSGTACAYWGFNGGCYEYCGKKTAAAVSTDVNNPDKVVFEIQTRGYSKLAVNGTLLGEYGRNSTTTGSKPLGILGFNNTNGYEMKAKLFEMKVWKNGELVSWLVPVIKDYDPLDKTSGTAGLYDVLKNDPDPANNFYGATHGKFTAGEADTTGSTIPDKETAATGILSLASDEASDYEPLHIWTSVLGGVPQTCIAAYSATENAVRTFCVTTDPETHTATAEFYNQPVENGEKAVSRPFLTEEKKVGAVTITYKVYRNATLETSGLSTTRKPVRIYLDGDMEYTVSPWQDVVYDKVLLDDRGTDGEYIAVLSSEGNLTANFECGDLDTYNIREINNAFYARDPYLVVLYRSGSLCVYDYTDGTLIYRTESNAGFADYLKGVLSSMSSSLSGLAGSGNNTENGTNTLSGSAPLTEISYTRLSLPGLKITSGAAEGTSSANGTSLADGTVSGGPSGTGSAAGIGKAEQTEVKADASAGGVSGGGTAAEEGTARTEDGIRAEEGVKSGEGAEAEETIKSEETVKAEESTGADTDTDTKPEPEAYEGLTVASAVYVPGEGIIGSDGSKLADDSEVEYVEGEGVYVDGELAYEESLYADNEKLAAAVEEAFRESAESASETEQAENGSTSEEESGRTDGTSGANGTARTGKTGEGPGETSGTAVYAGTESTGNRSNGTAGGGTGTEAGGTACGETAGDAAEGGDGNGAAAAESAEEPVNTEAPVLLVTRTERERQIREAGGKNVKIMNTVTGEMEEYDSEALAGGKLISAAEKKAAEAALAGIEKNEPSGDILAEAAEEEIIEEAAAAGAFVVAGGMGRTLDGASGNGLRLILLMAAAILLIIGGIYYMNLQKKRTRLRLHEKKESGEEENR